VWQTQHQTKGLPRLSCKTII